jgi:hypothetical protein
MVTLDHGFEMSINNYYFLGTDRRRQEPAERSRFRLVRFDLYMYLMYTRKDKKKKIINNNDNNESNNARRLWRINV